MTFKQNHQFMTAKIVLRKVYIGELKLKRQAKKDFVLYRLYVGNGLLWVNLHRETITS